MANTHRAIIENLDHSATIIAAGTWQECADNLLTWLNAHPLEEFQTAYVVEYLFRVYPSSASLEERNADLRRDRENLDYDSDEGLTVTQFIEKLQQMDPDAIVCLGYDGRDPVSDVMGSHAEGGDQVVVCPVVPRHPEGRRPVARVDWDPQPALAGA